MLSYEMNTKFLERLEKGGDLAKKQDSLLHYSERFTLAHGDGWYAYLAAEGEIRGKYTAEDGAEYYNYDIFEEALLDDDAIAKAEAQGTLTLDNNNWIEVQFFAQEEEGGKSDYLDIVADGDVAFTLSEGVDLFKSYVEDPETETEITKLVERWRNRK